MFQVLTSDLTIAICNSVVGLGPNKMLPLCHFATFPHYIYGLEYKSTFMYTNTKKQVEGTWWTNWQKEATMIKLK